MTKHVARMKRRNQKIGSHWLVMKAPKYLLPAAACAPPDRNAHRYFSTQPPMTL